MSASTLDRVSLTLLGWTITEPLIALCEWSEAHGDAVGAARARYRYNESTRAPGESAAALRGGRMNAKAGDRIVVESERVDRQARTGVIEEILDPDPPRYRVRWEDGHTSIIVPASGAVRVVEADRS